MGPRKLHFTQLERCCTKEDRGQGLCTPSYTVFADVVSSELCKIGICLLNNRYNLSFLMAIVASKFNSDHPNHVLPAGLNLYLCWRSCPLHVLLHIRDGLSVIVTNSHFLEKIRLLGMCFWVAFASYIYMFAMLL